jgi:hypothetical protein
MSAIPTDSPRDANGGMHLATIAHDGLLWDAYLAFDDNPHAPTTFRARVRFNRAGEDGPGSVTQTTVIIIEDSYEAAIAKARAFDSRQLEGLLRSALPDRA